MKMRIPFPCCALLLLSLLANSASAQEQKCAPPVALPTSTESNFFTDEKEVYLGDAIAEHIQKYYRVIEDESVTKYLSQIGERLTANLPLNKLRFSFSWLTCRTPMLLSCRAAAFLFRANWYQLRRAKTNWPV